MALTVVTDPLDPACNSYASLQAADQYASERSLASVAAAWEALDDEVKAKYLVNGSRSLDMAVEWIGDRFSRDQRLDWPRSNAEVDGFLLSSTEFPWQVTEATIEMALWLMENNGVTPVQQNAAFDSIKVGPISIDFNESAGIAVNRHFPDVVAYLIKDLGSIADPALPNGRSARTVRLIRA